MVRKHSNQFTTTILLTVLALALSSCAIKTKKTQTPVNNGPKTTTTVIIPSETKTTETPTSIEATPQDTQENEKPSQPETSNSQVKTLPKFGIIFSGGGAKAWAHIGVLKELQKLKWPVSSVGGFEWGAAIAALYAQNLSANEVEWEMSKLKEFGKWDLFIKAAFNKKMTTDLKVPFVCPSLNIAKQSAYLLNRGQLAQLVPFCIGSTVLTKPINQSIALMNDVPSLAQHLRATGANKIILINVLSQNTKRSFVKDYESADNIWWVESAALMAKKPAGVDDVLDINLDDFNIKDLDKRRDIVNKGAELSAAPLKKMAEKYGL